MKVKNNKNEEVDLQLRTPLFLLAPSARAQMTDKSTTLRGLKERMGFQV